MSWLSLSFAQPFLLWGLIALPVIWWLLRLTPPRPQAETFPPLKILARVVKREETPHKSPWWLTLLRLLLAALVILALTDPVLNPREKAAGDGAALAIVLDNGWAAAPDWDERVATAERLIEDARANAQPVVLALTAEAQNQEVGPFDADAALERLNAAQPRPVPGNRPAAYGRVAGTLEDFPGAAIAVLSDGLAATGDEAAFSALFSGAPGEVLWAEPERLSLLAATDAQNTADAFEVTATRSATDAGPRQAVAYASDDKGRRIAETTITFGAGETKASGAMRLPFELRNDFVSVGIEGQNQAAGLRVLDENSKRRRIGLISQSEADQAQPLLSPLYYIERALSPFADLMQPSSAELTEALPELLEQKPAVIVMADVGTLPAAPRQALIEWVNGGGTLVRFAGPRLAAADNDEDLLPVRLRLGERSLGGALSWTEPQPVAEFPPNGPFSDLAPPRDVTVNRQVLAEPSPDIVERSWANLADGTPLVTGVARGEGQIVLFHVTPEATWSNLPISGSFVEMLRRVMAVSQGVGGGGAGAALPPIEVMDGFGSLGTPPATVLALETGGEAGEGAESTVGPRHPPGYYGNDSLRQAHNLSRFVTDLAPLRQLPGGVTTSLYHASPEQDLKPWLLAAALALALADRLVSVALGAPLDHKKSAPVEAPPEDEVG